MYTEQILEYHNKLTRYRINGKIKNNELVWCKGEVILRLYMTGKSYSFTLYKDKDNTQALNKIDSIINRKKQKSKEVIQYKQV